MQGEGMRNCSDVGRRQLRDIRGHALMLADFIEGSGTLPSPLPRAWVRVRNLLVTLASLDEVASRPLYTLDDDGMCPADYGHELAAELGNACLSSVQLQYAWSALERLLKFVSPAKPSLQVVLKVLRCLCMPTAASDT